MKKVLFTATVDSHIRHFHIPYLKYFKEQGYEVHVATNGDEEIPYCDVKHVIPFERSPLKFNNLKAIKLLKKIIDNEEFEIIHCHTPMGAVVTRIAAMKSRKNGTRVIYTAHGFHFFKGAPIKNWLIFYPIEKILSKYTDTLITINQEDYDIASKKFHAKRTELVHGVGVDESKFNFEMSEEEKKEYRRSLGINEDDFVVICVGELNENKNQIMSMNAIKELVNEGKNIKLLLVGEGCLKEFYKSKIEEMFLNDNVLLLGYRKDVNKLMKISNLCISTSKREGLPVNIMEAQMSGLPVVATNCRGNRDLVCEENLVEIDDVDGLKNKILNYKTQNNCNIEYELMKIQEKMVDIYNNTLKITVLHVLKSNSFSGAENVACQIINMFDEDTKYNMVYVSPNGKIADTLRNKNIKYEPLKKLNRHNLKKIIKKYKPDVIHAHDMSATVISAVSKQNNSKVISHIHGTFETLKSRNIKSYLYFMAVKKCEKIIFVSKETHNAFVFKDILENKCVVLRNVINSEAINKKILEDNQDYETDIIFLGRLTPVKNPERFIDIVEKIIKNHPEVKISIVGTGELEEKIQKKITDEKLQKNIKMYGFMENPYKLLSKNKVMVMTSVSEGTPMAALEALSVGVPIVATPTDGLKEIIIQNKNGFLSDSSTELKDNIENILINEKTRLHYSENAIKIFEDFNSVDKYKNMLMFLYRIRRKK